MQEKDLIEKMAHLEEKGISRDKKLDEHDIQIKELQNTYKIMEKMDYRMGQVETSVSKIDKKLDEKIEECNTAKGKKWDKFIDYIFYAILGILLAYIATKMGLK